MPPCKRPTVAIMYKIKLKPSKQIKKTTKCETEIAVMLKASAKYERRGSSAMPCDEKLVIELENLDKPNQIRANKIFITNEK